MNGADRDGLAGRPQSFQTTCWTIVMSARDGDGSGARKALEALCATYWFPLYAFVRRKGHDVEAAQDLIQGFFARLLEKGDLTAVERSKGKFRSFLMAACTNYLANQADHNRAQKRGGGRTPISIDALTAEGRYGCEPSHEFTAERLFERQWALTLLEKVLKTLEAEMARAGKTRQLEALKPALLGNAVRAPYAAIGAAALGLSEEAARAAAHRLRRRYREILREEVAQTIDASDDLEEEIRSLFLSLSE